MQRGVRALQKGDVIYEQPLTKIIDTNHTSENETKQLTDHEILVVATIYMTQLTRPEDETGKHSRHVKLHTARNKSNLFLAGNHLYDI